MRCVLMIVLVPACWSAPRTATPSPPAEPTRAFAGFAPLFEEGAVARYAWRYEQVSDDPSHPEPHVKEMGLACTAGKARRWGELQMISWTCANASKDHADDPVLAGAELSPTWLTSPAGLWRLNLSATPPETEAEARALLAERIVLPAAPTADTQRDVLEEAGADGTPATVLVTEYRAEGDQGVWCRDQRLETWMKGWAERLCFHPTRGLVEHHLEGREGHSTEQFVRL